MRQSRRDAVSTFHGRNISDRGKSKAHRVTRGALTKGKILQPAAQLITIQNLVLYVACAAAINTLQQTEPTEQQN